MLPKDNVLPKSLYELKKYPKVFDMGFENIHSCENDWCLFWKEYIDLDSGPKCGSLRWKINQRTKEIMQGIPVKVLRYFSIISRFIRMFRLQRMAEDLRWNFTNQSTNAKMHYHVDSLT